MSDKVYANAMEVACAAQAGKAVAALPDVCLSPPAAPAGPIPVPYANTSHARDMKAGSKRVKIGGKPLMLGDQSYYATKPLGNEAATKSFGGSIVSHTITGKTYFGAWSTDVIVEGKGVCRHLDLTTSNHASYPGSTPPWLNTATMDMVKVAETAIAKNRCGCCNKKKHATGAPMGRDEWYQDNIDKKAHAGGWNQLQRSVERQAYRALRGQPTSVRRMARMFIEPPHRLGMSLPTWTRHRFEASTGIDCTAMFDRRGDFKPLAAAAIAEAFLDSPDAAHYVDGVRYFFGHRVP